MKCELKKKLNKLKFFYNRIIEFVLYNRLFITYFLISIIGICLARQYTIGEFFTIRTLLMNSALILLSGSVAYFLEPKKRFKYLFFLVAIFTTLEMTNVIYFKFYSSFASFGELATAGQAETVADSILDKLSILDFIFLLGPYILYKVHKKLSMGNYYYYVSKCEKSKRSSSLISIIASVMMFFVFITSSTTDFSRLNNQWNRNLNVEAFGLVFYQMNDLFQTLTPKIFTLFGYDEAAADFIEYYSEYETSKSNKYTGIMEGKNVIFIHMESIQTWLMDTEFNGVETTPYLNKLAEEGMFFSNFFPQISTGTSSDSEFTLLSSLFPAESGTVFVSYYNREYNTLPKILGEYGYHSFSMHGNNFSMWNRINAHPSLGYDDFYYKEKYDFTEEDVIGLGINDLLWFEQTFNYLVDIEENYENYMGTLITLSHHSPFNDVSEYIEYDISYTYTDENFEEITTDYLSSKVIGRYLKSAHFADYALGMFMEMVETSDYFNDTLFVLYGDHDAKFSQTEFNYFLNYDPVTGELTDDVEYDSFDHLLSKSTPLVFWTKDPELREVLNGEYDYPFGMIDISPTLLNMYGLENMYALGNDIFNVKNENFVIFPDASFLTKDLYYNNSKQQYKIINENVILEEGYLDYYLGIAEKKLQVSSSIIMYDLVKKEGDNIVLGEKNEN